MPIYVYKCEDCQGIFEKQQKMTDEALTQCELCDNGLVKRVIIPPAISFRGDGFHVNDYDSYGRRSAGDG